MIPFTQNPEKSKSLPGDKGEYWEGIERRERKESGETSVYAVHRCQNLYNCTI